MSDVKPLGRWRVRRATSKKTEQHGGHAVKAVLHLSLVKRVAGKEKTLAKLTPVALVQIGTQREPEALPVDRAKAWEEFIGWVKHLVIFPDPDVQARQYQNRLAWESWAHTAGAEKPKDDELYDWQRDEPALQRLRPHYLHLAARLAELIGHPRKSDLDRLYPNKFDDEGLSDQARAAIRDLKTLFGAEMVK